jgi:hypothetical protein
LKPSLLKSKRRPSTLLPQPLNVPQPASFFGHSAHRCKSASAGASFAGSLLHRSRPQPSARSRPSKACVRSRRPQPLTRRRALTVANPDSGVRHHLRLVRAPLGLARTPRSPWPLHKRSSPPRVESPNPSCRLEPCALPPETLALPPSSIRLSAASPPPRN